MLFCGLIVSIAALPCLSQNANDIYIYDKNGNKIIFLILRILKSTCRIIQVVFTSLKWRMIQELFYRKKSSNSKAKMPTFAAWKPTASDARGASLQSQIEN